MNEKTDLEKGLDELNDEINVSEKKETPTIEDDLNKSISDLESNMSAANLDSDLNKEIEEEEDDLDAPQMEDARSGEVDVEDFIEKSLGYMEGVYNLTKSLKDDIQSLMTENADLKKALSGQALALGGVMKSHLSLHKAIKNPTALVESKVAETFSRDEEITPSRAQTVVPTLVKEIEGEEIDLKKTYFDDAEVNILAKALREKTITDAEYSTAQKTYELPKRLLS